MTITIIGLGLMGGSMALALKDIGASNYLIGVDNNISHRQDALKLKLVDEILPFKDSYANSELIIIATPVEASVSIISELLDKISEHQTVIDLGSTKGVLCSHVKNHINRAHYVAAHPIAGTENSGPQSAEMNLYTNKKMVICEKGLSSEVSLSLALNLFRQLDMTVVFMDAAEHDKHLAYISHLSHVSSFALGLTVLDLEKDDKNIFNLAGSGFSSTARLAKSSPEMWKAILLQNKEHIIPALESYISFLESFKADIFEDNEQGLEDKMTKANRIRKLTGAIF